MNMTKQEMQNEIDRLKAIIGIKEAAGNRNRKMLVEKETELKSVKQENRILRTEIEYLNKR